MISQKLVLTALVFATTCVGNSAFANDAVTVRCYKQISEAIASAYPNCSLLEGIAVRTGVDSLEPLIGTAALACNEAGKARPSQFTATFTEDAAKCQIQIVQAGK